MNIPWKFIVGLLTLVLAFVGTIVAVSSHLGKRMDAGIRHTETLS